MPGLPVDRKLLEFTQTHAHRVGDAIQPSHPLSSPSPPAPNPSQHQGLFQLVNALHEVAKVLEFQLQRQSSPRSEQASFNFMATVPVPSDSGVQENSLSLFPFLSIYLPWSDGTGFHDLSFLECWVLSQLFHSSLSPSSRGSLLIVWFLPLGWCHLLDISAFSVPLYLCGLPFISLAPFSNLIISSNLDLFFN